MKKKLFKVIIFLPLFYLIMNIFLSVLLNQSNFYQHDDIYNLKVCT